MVALVRWFVTADEQGAALFACARTPAGGLHIEEECRFQTPWTDYHEHHRPSSRGRGPAASAAQQFAGQGHEREEMLQRTVRDLIAWIAQTAHNCGVGSLTLFTGPRLLGLLRAQSLPPSMHVDFEECDLMPLTPSELARHPAVRAVMSTPGIDMTVR